MIFVPATPGSQLKSRYIEEIEGAGFKIEVVEQSGVTLKRMFQRSDRTHSGKKNATTSTVWSAAPVEKGLAEVPVLLMSWSVNFAARNTSRNITKCIHPQKGTAASSETEGAMFGDVETFL